MDTKEIATLQRIERMLNEMTRLRYAREQDEPSAEEQLSEKYKALKDMLAPVHGLVIKYSSEHGCYVLCSD